MSKFLLLTLSLCFFSNLSFSQEEVPIKKFQVNGLFKNTIGLELGGTSGIIGVHIAHFLSKNVVAQAGLGFPAAGAKVAIYPWSIKRDKFRPFIGIGGMHYFASTEFNFTDYTLYSPLGLSWFTNRRVNLSLDFGPAYVNDYGNNIDNGKLLMYGSFKVGYRFTFTRFKNRQKQINPEIIIPQ